MLKQMYLGWYFLLDYQLKLPDEKLAYQLIDEGGVCNGKNWKASAFCAVFLSSVSGIWYSYTVLT